MMPLACQNIVEQVSSHRDMFLLLVSEDCPFCREVLDNLESLGLVFDTLVVNTDQCAEAIDQIIDWPAVPMLVQYHNGEEVKRAVGVPGIMGFEHAPDTTIGERDGEATTSATDAA